MKSFLHLQYVNLLSFRLCSFVYISLHYTTLAIDIPHTPTIEQRGRNDDVPPSVENITLRDEDFVHLPPSAVPIQTPSQVSDVDPVKLDRFPILRSDTPNDPGFGVRYHIKSMIHTTNLGCVYFAYRHCAPIAVQCHGLLFNLNSQAHSNYLLDNDNLSLGLVGVSQKTVYDLRKNSIGSNGSTIVGGEGSSSLLSPGAVSPSSLLLSSSSSSSQQQHNQDLTTQLSNHYHSTNTLAKERIVSSDSLHLQQQQQKQQQQQQQQQQQLLHQHTTQQNTTTSTMDDQISDNNHTTTTPTVQLDTIKLGSAWTGTPSHYTQTGRVYTTITTSPAMSSVVGGGTQMSESQYHQQSSSSLLLSPQQHTHYNNQIHNSSMMTHHTTPSSISDSSSRTTMIFEFDDNDCYNVCACTIGTHTIYAPQYCIGGACLSYSTDNGQTWIEVTRITNLADCPKRYTWQRPITAKLWKIEKYHVDRLAIGCFYLEQEVAVKKSRNTGERTGDDPIREALFYQALQSPFTPRLLAIHDSPQFDPNFHWIVTEYLAGKDLYHLLSFDKPDDTQNTNGSSTSSSSSSRPHRVLSIDYVGIMFAQLVLGVYYLHNILNIAHLDLKPSNIFVSGNFMRFIIADLGVARRLTVRGKPYDDTYTNGNNIQHQDLLNDCMNRIRSLPPNVFTHENGTNIITNRGALKTRPFYGMMGTKDYMCNVIIERNNAFNIDKRRHVGAGATRCIMTPEQGRNGPLPSSSFPCHKVPHEVGLCKEHYSEVYGFDARLADIFSLGVILFTALFKIPPFCGYANRENKHYQALISRTAGVLARDYSNQYPSLTANMDRSALSLIDAMVNPNTEQRLFIEDVVLHPWVVRYINMLKHIDLDKYDYPGQRDLEIQKVYSFKL